MSDGLITRIGKWIDSKFEEKATVELVEHVEKALHEANMTLVTKLKDNEAIMQSMARDLADLKTRMEKMELYSGMTRKVDPTKPPVAKSAFSM